MDFKKKLRKFLSLKQSADSGFTLVELIVVIAILAILAGVAVPAYTGYIKRAEAAKDQLLIGAVNEAFAGACLEAGIELATVTDAKISVVEQCVFGVSSVDVGAAPVADTQLVGIYNTFNQLYEGNFATPFKTENVLSLYWVPEENSFKMDHESGVPTLVMLSSGMVSIPADVVAAISSSFIGQLKAEDLETMFDTMQDGATDALMGTVDKTVDEIADKLGTGGGFVFKALYSGLKLVCDEDQLGAWVALQTSGLKNNTEVFGNRYDAINEGLQSRDAATRDAAMNEFSNAMLLYTANVLHDEDSATVHNAVKDNYFNTDTNLVSTGGNGATVVSAAIRESLYQAYLKTDEGAQAYANVSGTEAEKKLALTQDEAFTKYLESDQCGNDISGLIATMKTIQTNKDSIGTDDLVQQGMSNEDANKLFGALVGY